MRTSSRTAAMMSAEVLLRCPLQHLGSRKAVWTPPAQWISSTISDAPATRDVSDLVQRYRDDWPGISSWVAWAAPSFSFLASVFRQVLDCEAVVLGGRLPPTLAQRIAQSIRWAEDIMPHRRNAGPPLSKAVPAEVTSRSAAVGAAAIPLRSGPLTKRTTPLLLMRLKAAERTSAP